jgi:multicomponent Na+:H+ antiporter subunit G
MAYVLDILSWLLIMAGGFVGITGAVGLFRFPDFYTRMHAASMTDTLTAGLILVGLMLQAGSILTVLKLALIFFIMAYTAPTAAHVLAKTARHVKLKPYLDGKGDAP